MDFQVLDYQGAGRDGEIASLLSRVFVGEGYTNKSAEGMLAVSELRKRGGIMLALSSGRLAGMVIFVHPSSPARQVAGPGEAEIHLLAVDLGAWPWNSIKPDCRMRGPRRFMGHRGIVLSTQPTMRAARQLC